VKKYNCIYYITTSGKAPVKEFIEFLADDSQDSFFHKVELLEKYGPQLRRPHTEYVAPGIFGLRFVGKEGQIRLLFFFSHGDRIVFTNGFVKKTIKIPQGEIKIAEQRRKEYLQRRR